MQGGIYRDSEVPISVPNQTGKPAVLPRQAWREGTRVRKKIIANLSKLPPEIIKGVRTVLKGGVSLSGLSDFLDIERSLDHGNVIAVLGAASVPAPDSLVPDAVAEITSPDFPGERLPVCLKPRLRQERRRNPGGFVQPTVAPGRTRVRFTNSQASARSGG